MILKFKDFSPKIDPSVFIAENATIIGRVEILQNASIWFGTVVRADVNSIHIGKNSNIQDLCVLHVSDSHSLIVEENVTVGHGVTLHACKIGKNSLIGIGSIILDGAVIGENSVVAAGSVIPPNRKYPANSLIKGSPAIVVRSLNEEELKKYTWTTNKYCLLAQEYR